MSTQLESKKNRASGYQLEVSQLARRVMVISAMTALLAPAVMLAQATNQIVTVQPATAQQGAAGVVVTFTLDTDSPPAPPAGVLPTSVAVGALSGSSVTYQSRYEVTAVFDIPGSEPVGAKDCVVTFSTPHGTLTYTKAGGFTVTRAADAPPSITQQPQSRTVRVGASVTFSVVASGGDPLSYQWQKDHVDINGASAASMTITSVIEADAGDYRCVVSNSAGTAVSDAATLSIDQEPPTPDSSYLVVDTAQELCFDDSGQISCPVAGQQFHGQDAQHQGFAAGYSISGDGLTVLDSTTGLTWQRSPDITGEGEITASDKLTWSEAQARPAALNAAVFGGYDDWRLPSIKELYSLIDFRGEDPSGMMGNDTSGLQPFIDTDFFEFAYGDTSAGERVIDAQYASSTLYVASSNKLFGVNLADGRIKGYDLTKPNGSVKTFLVQCVRGNTSYGANILADNGDGTITDSATDLMWTKDDAGSSMDWETALAWVESRNQATYLGYSDWRLPNAKELQSIVDYSRSPDTSSSAALDELFLSTSIINEGGAVDYPCYWSSTTHKTHSGSGASAAYVCFGRCLGWMQEIGGSCYNLTDVHGAGAQRSDPKSGSYTSYYLGSACDGGSAYGHGPQGDVIRVANGVRLVRDVGGDLTKSYAGLSSDGAQTGSD